MGIFNDEIFESQIFTNFFEHCCFQRIGWFFAEKYEKTMNFFVFVWQSFIEDVERGAELSFYPWRDLMFLSIRRSITIFVVWLLTLCMEIEGNNSTV